MERHIDKLLVAIDGSEPAMRALKMAIALARVSKAELTILEVVEEFGPLPGLYGLPPEGVDRTAWLAERRFDEAYPAIAEAGVRWARRVEEGYPAEVIVRVAAEGGHDMIVVGSHGHRAIERFLVGSVSDRVVHHAPCSVVVVR